jgi:integrase
VDAVYLDVFQRFMSTKVKRPTVSMLSRPLLDEYMAWLADPETSVTGKRTRAKVTIAKFVRAAQLMWVWAEESDQWSGIPRPKIIRGGDLPHSAPQPVQAPTWLEMDACIRACRTPTLRKLAVWLRYTGLRVGESMMFLWSDVDMQRGELTIRPDVDKRKRGRVVPLSDRVLEEIATWGKREGYLIPSARNAGVREREARGRDMARAWARAGVRAAVWTRRPDHAFRKGFKSELLAVGAHPDAVDYLQGHGSGSRWLYMGVTQLIPMAREALAKVPAVDTNAKVVNIDEARSQTAHSSTSTVRQRRVKAR